MGGHTAGASVVAVIKPTINARQRVDMQASFT